MKLELQDIINNIDIVQHWHDDYCEFVPKFIESAKSHKNWQEWDKNLSMSSLNEVVTNACLHYGKDISPMKKSQKSKLTGKN